MVESTERVPIVSSLPTQISWRDFLNAQSDYLLDQISGGRRALILELECHDGFLLRQAQSRDLDVVGITRSSNKLFRCRDQGIAVEQFSYRNMPHAWRGRFTGVIAQEFFERSVQIRDALSDMVHRRYREVFEAVHRVLAREGRFITAALHFSSPGQVDPRTISGEPSTLTYHSDEYFFALLLQRIYPGWLPQPGQLEEAADGLFTLINKEAKRPAGQLKTELRQWQFREVNPPTQFLCHTWQAI